MIIKIEKLKEIQEIYKWNGKGTKEDPIIMDFACYSVKYLVLKSIKSHIIIKNLKINNLTLKFCQNITIKDNDIHTHYMEFYCNILIEENKINEMASAFSKDCVIRNNKLHAYNMNFESNNSWAEFFIYDEYFLNSFAFSLISLIFGFGLIILGLINVNFILSGEVSIYIGIVFLIISGLSAPFAIYIKYQISKMKNLPPNVYENNLPYN